jgi:hypothetical protein
MYLVIRKGKRKKREREKERKRKVLLVFHIPCAEAAYLVFSFLKTPLYHTEKTT